MSPKLIGKECKFVTHVPSHSYDKPDVHIIKELLWYDDGTRQPNIRVHRNYQRPFWVTAPSKRNHKECKEWEKLENLVEHRCTQSELKIRLSKALGNSYYSPRDGVRKLSESPYAYGTDIPSEVFIKREYQQRFPDLFSSFSVAGYDVETDVLHATKRIIMASTVFKREVLVVVDAAVARGYADFKSMLYAKSKQMLIDMYEQGYEFRFEIRDSSLEIVKTIFEQIHKWKPDFLEVWNISFDIPKTLDTIAEAKADPLEILCDPDIPYEFRVCEWTPDRPNKTTASGKFKPSPVHMQWHVLNVTASFYVIDGMSAYKHIRLAEQELSSYSLEYVMNLNLKRGKLKFEIEGVIDGSLEWHVRMQRDHPVEYAMYNGFDSAGMLQLDEKTKDLQFTLPSFSGASKFQDFKSQPRRIRDAFFFYLLEQGYVLGTPGTPPDKTEPEPTAEDEDDDDEDEDNDDDVNAHDHLGLAGWISTLPAFSQVPGMNIVSEDPTMYSGFRGFVYDSDAVSAYPSATDALNVSKDTTRYEISDIDGVDRAVFCAQNMHLLYGPVNAVEYCTAMFQMPTLDEMLDDFIEAHPDTVAHV